MSGLVLYALVIPRSTHLLRCNETMHMEFVMADPIKDYQTFAQQSWDTWMRQFQQAGGGATPPSMFAAPPRSPADDLLARSTAGLKGFLDWMQGAVVGPAATTPDWQQQLQQLFGSGAQPFANAFAGIDQRGAQGFAQQWQQWLQAAQQGGFADLHGSGAMAPLGFTREQQLQQQALSKAMLEYLETSARYQALIQRANAQGVERMQAKLAYRSEHGQPIESLKALYDVWVDAAEEAYAEIALSDEFREAYGAMVNAQMHVRHLQQQETERFCRELGMPTRSEVASLGQRMQELRREVAELKRKRNAAVVTPLKAAAAKAPAAKAPVAKAAPSKSGTSTKSSAKPTVAATKSRNRSASRATARTRK